MTLYEYMSLILEGSVLGILILEYLYDRQWNEHVKRLKRRAKRRYEFEYLTQGEHK